MIDAALAEFFASDGKDTGTVYQCKGSNDQTLRAFLPPFNGFPSHVVLYEVESVASGPMLKREALRSVPLLKKSKWVWEQYLEARKRDSRYGRDLALDELLDRYRNELKNWRERNGNGLNMLGFDVEKAVKEQLEADNAQDKPMRDFLLDVLAVDHQLDLDDQTKQIAESHSPPYSCLDGATNADFCARYHTHGDAPCHTTFPPRATPEYNAWHFYENVAPSKPELWDGCQNVAAAREMFRGKMQKAFAEIQSDRWYRATYRLARLPVLPKIELEPIGHTYKIEPIGETLASGLLQNNLEGRFGVPLRDMELWVGVLSGYAEDLDKNRKWNPSLTGDFNNVQKVLKLFREVRDKGEVLQLDQPFPDPYALVDLNTLDD
ncbi:hypothetical protein P171DRAFT_49432 [Karstenula rhodostoma CBS 690.94]|uniref:Uncharacterized protein n=1 Tax=Karstenula rhodostoma CBS 690.94 TaxID=1392251 RepID=A0A9P4PG96_9PLEO|nr:hypothetical protein P171DRAFT_49432 [Karstenula rhodostoma CBS 690.94]